MNIHSFSIIICCYNASKRLPTTLEYLSKLDIDGLQCELIVVDNNSSDNSAEVVNNLWHNKFNNPFELKLLKQPTPGKTNAWNLGVNNANGDYLVMCDDDNWLPKDYLKKALIVLQECPKFGMLGGRSIGVFEKDPPVWFKNVSSYWAVGKQYENSGEITNEHNKLWGAGTIFSKSALNHLKSLNYTQKFSGIKAEGMAEDCEIFILLKLIGYKMYYSNDLVIRHFMPKERISWASFMGFMQNFGKSNWKFDAYERNNKQEFSIRNYLKSGVLYAMYITALRIRKTNKKAILSLTPPQEGAAGNLVDNYFLKYRFIGLLKAFFRYRKEVKVFQNSKIFQYKD